MIKESSSVTILVILVSLVGTLGLSQEIKSPLSIGDVERLLKEGVSSGAIARLIDNRGINFEVTQNVKDKLKNAGATSEVIVSLERIALEVERKRLEEERRRAEEERQRAEEERRRLEERQQRALQETEKRPDAPSSAERSEYVDVSVPKIVSGAFVNELENRRVRIVVNYFALTDTQLTTKLPPELAARYIGFDAYDYNRPGGFLTVLVPKQMADQAFKVRAGQVVTLYGQLIGLARRMTAFGRPTTQWTKELVLVLERLER